MPNENRLGQTAASKLRLFPKALTACSAEASLYAKCVLMKEGISKNDCSDEFRKFSACVRKSLLALK
jgi:hypothetical protein